MNRVMIDGTSGIGSIGGDFWEIVPVGQGHFRSVVLSNWMQLTMGGWGTPAKLIAPGIKGPIGTIRLEALREGIQDAEIRILIEKALADEAIKTKLGTAWADKAKNMLQRYTHEILMGHPGGGKGFGGTFHDPFTWYAYILPAQRKALYEVASALERIVK